MEKGFLILKILRNNLMDKVRSQFITIKETEQTFVTDNQKTLARQGFQR